MQATNAQGRAEGEGWERTARAGQAHVLVRILDEDPELGRYLAPRDVRLAASVAIAPLHTVGPGTASFLIDEPLTHAHFGLLVLGGLIARHLSFGQLGAVEFYGPGDLVRPWTRRTDGTAPGRWDVLTTTRLAALDGDFASRVQPWPELVAGLLDRAAERSDAQALQAALHQTKRTEDRVLLALWHFAGRWGESGPEGRTVSLPNITGALLARYVGARRQTVSTALGRLADSGDLRRNPDGSFTLPRRPPQLETR
ncbi:MAG TPA: hypothetical protein VG186_07570 [Solirubrobacteraceae bacterium]|nr:hypothetical protein [Solirubrobacteraceae bacterium]